MEMNLKYTKVQANVGDVIRYMNSREQIGKVVKKYSFQLVVIPDNCSASQELFDAGHSIGDCISPSQVLEIVN